PRVRLVEQTAELGVRRMREVGFEPGAIVELDQTAVLEILRLDRLVRGADPHATADPAVAHRGDGANGALERRRQRAALIGPQIGTRREEDEVQNHRRTLRTSRVPSFRARTSRGVSSRGGTSGAAPD